MDNSQKIEQIIQGMTKFNSETREILDSVKERMDKFLNQHYHVNENPIVLKTLEQEYEDILATNGDYEYSSAVGYRAILKNGDTIKATVNSGNGGHFFLNGERMTADYTYTGDDCEMVSVWVFENINDMLVAPISLNDTPSFTPYEVIIKNIGQTPVINTNYYSYVIKLTTDKYILPTAPRACKVFVSNGLYYFNNKIPFNVKEVYSDCEEYNSADNFSINGVSDYLTKISLPNCRIFTNYGTVSNTFKNLEEWEWGKLVTIKNTHLSQAMFVNCNLVYIPDTVKTIEGEICTNCTTIKLECNKADYIDPKWCYNTPTNFTMAKDWSATVNIAVAAKKWGKDKFVDLFENYLRDLTVMSDDGTTWTEQTITIPKAIYDILTEEEFAIARNKGWSVGVGGA